MPDRRDAPAPARDAMAAYRVTKSFGGTQALLDFGLTLAPGEVHALVGANGSGKSTFIKILAGVYQADAGELEVAGSRYDLTHQTPDRARTAGLRFVHQDLGIFPELTVAENLCIGYGFPVGLAGRIRWRAARTHAQELLRRFHLSDIDPQARAATLSTPQRAMLAIARALQDQAESVLVLDEPTAALPPEETALLLSSIRRLADSGHSVLLVTHRLDEIRSASDRVTCVRDGRLAGSVEAKGLSEGDLVELILGRRLARRGHPPLPGGASRATLEARGLAGGPIQGVDLAVASGEIVGIAGLLGSGRTELLELLYGALTPTRGEISVDGTCVKRMSPRRATALGMAMVPEDRQGDALFEGHTVRENMTSGHARRYFDSMWLRDRRMNAEVAKDVQRFMVKARDGGAPIGTLSGGNQQKVVLARWLRQGPKVLLLDEPTQGIDVGSREDIYRLVSQAAADGAAVVVVASELEELTRVCHRILVLAQGRIVDELRQPVETHHLLETVLSHAGGTLS